MGSAGSAGKLLACLLGLGVATAAVAQAGAAGPAAGDKDKLICRKYLEPGSLAKKKKLCFTAADWQKIRESAQDNAKFLQDNNRGRTGGD